MNYGFQRGIVLMMVLSILVVITILGVSSIKTAILSEKMAANMLNQQATFQLAERALKLCEERVLNHVRSLRAEIFPLEMIDYLLKAEENGVKPNYDNNAFWEDDTKTLKLLNDELPQGQTRPRCMVESLEELAKYPTILRITVRAYGEANSAAVIALQSNIKL